MPDRSTIPLRFAACGLALGALCVLPACRGDRTDKPPRQFFPDMDDGPKMKPQTATGFFADGRAMRPRPVGTVAFGRSAHAADAARADLLRDDPAFYLGRESFAPDAPYVLDIPVALAVDEKLLLHGQERFNIYCSACHGYDGRGKGMVGLNWATPIPSYMDATYTDKAKEPKAKDGYLFHTIRNGVPNEGKPDDPWKMPPYAHALSERDAWAVVAYIRTLQAANAGGLQDLTETQREQLMKSKPAPAAPPAPAGAAQ